MDNKYPI
jgi:hypothetical protein